MTPRDANLRSRSIRSAGWAGFRLAVLVPSQIASIAILSRWLSPEDFGLVAICVVILGLCEVISQTGVEIAIVREPGDIRPLLHPSWSLQVARGFGLAAVVALAAYPVAWFQREPQLAGLLLITAIAPAIEGFRSVGLVILSRELKQGRVTAYEVTLFVLGLTTQTALAYWLRSAWAIVLNLVVVAGFRVIGGYILHTYRPRFSFDWAPLRKYFRFGIQYNLARTADHLLLVVDRFIIGRALGTAPLGIYERMNLLPQTVIQRFYSLAAVTALPSLSAVLSDPVRFRRNARRFLAVSGALFVVGSGIVYALAGQVVEWILGPQFVEYAPLLPILVIAGLFRGLCAPLQILCSIHAYGRPQVTTSVVQLGAIVVALPVGISLGGLEGAAWAVVATSAVGFAVLTIQCAALRVDVPRNGDDAAPAATDPAETARSGDSVSGAVPVGEGVNA